MSTAIPEDTLMEEEAESSSASEKAATNHMTLRDVSAIAKETEMETDLPHADDLSVSLLPFLPSTTNAEDDKQHNKSIGSTISDKTFVKTSLKPFSSEEDEGEETTADETMMEESFTLEKMEKSRPLLLTADQSIRLPPPRRSSRVTIENPTEKIKVKQEKLSYREPMETGQ